MFQDVEQPAPDIKQNGVQAAETDLMQLFGQTTEPDVDEGESQVESEAKAEEGEQAPSPEQPEAESRQDQQRKFKIHVNGEEREVTEKELTEGFLRQQDYTSKTTELAQERQRLEAEFGQAQQLRNQYDAKLTDMQQQLEALIPPEPDWGKLASDNPQLYHQQKAAWDRLQSQLKSVKEQRQRVQQENAQAAHQQAQQFLAQQRDQLIARRKELSDPEKWNEFFTNVGQYAVHNYGFNPQELAMIGDHRLYDIAYKAMKYDELHGGAKSKESRKKDIPPLTAGEKPDDKPSSKQLRDARAKLAKSGSVSDAAKAFGAMFD